MNLKTLNSRAALCALMVGLSPVSVGHAQEIKSAKQHETSEITDASLVRGFQDPPVTARPRVWWHWLNGNITKEGIRKDLEWMKRIGIGGAQTFDANLLTPQLVDKRLVYMTPEWKDAFAYAAATADNLNLELAVAASPGWSETGGPWVTPADGIKKLAWSETEIKGGQHFNGVLPKPPLTTGLFQDAHIRDVAVEAVTGNTGRIDPHYYGDAAAIAYQVAKPRPNQPTPKAFLNNNTPIDVASLVDPQFQSGVEVPRGTADAPTALTYVYPEPQTVRGVSVFLPGTADLFSPPTLAPRLEISEDGQTWRHVADITISTAPTTVSFPAVTSRYFRLVLAPAPDQVPLFTPGEGVDVSDIAGFFVASPTMKITNFRLSNEDQVNQWEAKAGFAVSNNYYGLDEGQQEVRGVPSSQVIDLTSKMRPDGTLDWDVPKGHWRVLRLGFTLTGKINHPATHEATGLEVDKLDADAVRRYAETYIGMYRDAAGPNMLGARGVKALLTDSTEVGSFNWTPKMLEQFERLRGYNPRPWLPALTGVIVENREKTDAFLYDFRATIAELHSSEHYGTIARVAHENGLKVYGEALEGGRVSLGDDMDMRSYADVPMSALWTFTREKGPLTTHLSDMKGASSIAHILGKPVVSAESMTSALHPWGHSPAELRRVIDLEFASGINLPIIHTSVHVPVDDKKPGLSLLIFGQYFNRNDSWAEMAKPWIDYIARNSYLLQQGVNVADVGYFYGEDSPSVGLTTKTYFKDVPQKYAYDFINPSTLTGRLIVDDGTIVASPSARYKVLYLGGNSGQMTLKSLRKLAQLAEAGATIVGMAPARSPSLVDDPTEFEKISARLWSGDLVTNVGKGRVIASTDVEAALASIGVVPDVAFDNLKAGQDVLFVHRRLEDGDLYFVNNRTAYQKETEARFRVTGKVPELWRADTNEITPLSYRIEGATTVVPLSFEPDESFFVVFRKDAVTTQKTVKKAIYKTTSIEKHGWSVRFQEGRGAPAQVMLPELASLSENSDPGVRYFSGEATYSREIRIPQTYRKGDDLWLDLGQVGDVAEVRLNGIVVGSAWRAPYRVPIAAAARPGKNLLEVRVANLWINRMIGDAQPGATKITYTPLKTYRADAPLRPAGLIGPVQLLSPQ